MDSMNITSNSTATAQDACVLSDEEIKQSYNLVLRIVSVFVLLIVSFLGASISVVSSRVKFLHINPIIINTGKFFGSGVVLATGFIHILPDAMATLTDPCLPDSWNAYGAYAGLFAMLAALGMQLLEFLAHQKHRSMMRKHVHLTANHDVKDFAKKEPTNHETHEHIHHQAEKPEQRDVTTEQPEEMDLTTAKSEKIEVDALPENKEQSDIVVIEIPHIECHTIPAELCEASAHCHGIAFQEDEQQNKISTYLLEFGIAIHSVLIGLTLGTTTDSFVALFIALCFHQFFEAIALGAQIANLKSTSLRSAIYMVAFFTVTTPTGIAIGIGIHAGTYNPKSVSSLLVTGILDSLSAGILIYVALVNLITAEMGANAHGFYSLRSRLKILYFGALYLGAALMAVIGRWA